jgi:NTP pyrophosphatase (non-canonical NTP hydrolase)
MQIRPVLRIGIKEVKNKVQQKLILYKTKYSIPVSLFNKKNKNNTMTIEAAQQQVDQWIKTIGVRYFSELTNLGILMEEVGELSRLMVRTYGDQSFKESDKGKELADEMADILWVLICLANQTGVNLTEALQKNIEKKTIRDADRHQQNEKLQP